ncbi:MAG TPA: DUF6089 family protein [Flavobacteriales bacterium]|nr:DUF6089 family protein [Flavobacteriales bacterium]HPH82078.1 DUF6089 family protein [Flavobacteriales bacterium]
MRKWIFLSLIGLATSFSANSQVFNRYSELGLFGGVSYYMGELNPGKQFFMVRPGGGLVYRYNTSRRFAWEIHGLYGSVQAEDARSGEDNQILRNLSFRSQIIEFAGLLHFNFFNYEIGNPETPATPYIFGGLGLFRFNPKADFQGEWIALQPLGTEGQGSPVYADRKQYSLMGANIPFGFGVKFHAFGRLGFSLEWGLRKTFTDYLDDVSTTYADPDVLFATHGELAALLADRSLVNPGKINAGRQRGNSTNKDWYSFAGLTITYKIVPRKAECAAYK